MQSIQGGIKELLQQHFSLKMSQRQLKQCQQIKQKGKVIVAPVEKRDKPLL